MFCLDLSWVKYPMLICVHGTGQHYLIFRVSWCCVARFLDVRGMKKERSVSHDDTGNTIVIELN